MLNDCLIGDTATVHLLSCSFVQAWSDGKTSAVPGDMATESRRRRRHADNYLRRRRLGPDDDRGREKGIARLTQGRRAGARRSALKHQTSGRWRCRRPDSSARVMCCPKRPPSCVRSAEDERLRAPQIIGASRTQRR